MKRLLLLAIATTFYMLVYGQNTNCFNTTVSLISKQRVSIAELEQAKLLFKEKCNTADTHWLYHYYFAYINMVLCFRYNDLDTKQKLLIEAKHSLNQIIKGDISEIETLKGYCYMAYIVTDPTVNGPKYTHQVIDCYNKALKSNPNNPRAIILKAIFQSQLQRFFGSTYQSYKFDMSRAKRLLSSADSTSLQPHWGKAFIP